MQLTGSPSCSGAVTLAFQLRLLHTGATITSTTPETPAMLNLRRGLLQEQEKPDDSLHPLLLTTPLMNCSFHCVCHRHCLTMAQHQNLRRILSKLCPAHLHRPARLLVII